MNRTVLRLIGAVLFAFGSVLLLIPLFAIDEALRVHVGLTPSAEVQVIACGVVAAFCMVAGFRLVALRPTRQGSLLTPPWWLVLAIVFYGLGLIAFAAAVARGEIQLALVAAGFALLGFGSSRAARTAQATHVSPVFPPETSLLSQPAFVPPGFRQGLEILNDNTTPMEFVVSMLQDPIGFSRADAIGTMLAIHTKGGALLAVASLQEAERVAVAVAAHAAGHPLVCRAVSLE